MDAQVSQQLAHITFDDVVSGRAYIRLPFVSKLLLCHWAGAPWFDRDPKAFLHPLQVEVLAHKEREQIVHGASRLGKSVLGGCHLICATALPYHKVACGASRYDHVSHEWQYLYRGMKTIFRNHGQAFQRLRFVHQTAYHDYDCHPIWGTRAMGMSTDSDDGAQFLGNEFTDVILGEGSHISADILDRKIKRATDGALMQRQDGRKVETGYMYIFTTPKGHEGCSAAEWERVHKQTKREPSKLEYGAVPFPESVWLREANILENPVYDRAVFEARKRSLSTAAFEEQYMGKMTFASGRVYAEWREDLHVVPMPPLDYLKKCRFGVGFDTGANFGAVLAAIGPDGIRWWLADVYTSQVTIDVSCAYVKEMVTNVLAPVCGTEDFEALSQRVDLWIVDPASQHKLEIIQALDIPLGTPVSSRTSADRSGKMELIPSIDAIRAWFAADQCFLTEEATNAIDQMRKYIWKTVKSIGSKRAPVIREPRKEYDHVLDAGRMILLPLADEGPLTEPPPAYTLNEAWDMEQRERVHGPLRGILDAADRAGGIQC